MDLQSENKEALDLVYEKFLKLEGATGKETLSLEELDALINNFEGYFCSTSAVDKSVTLIVKFIELIVRHGSPPSLEILEERDFDESDFFNVAESAVVCFANLQKLMNYKVLDMEKEIKYSFLCNALILFALHHKKYMWSNERSETSSKGFFKELKLVTGYKDLSSILCDENYNPSIFYGILQKLKSLLRKDSWHKNPCSGYLFVSLLVNVKHPFLAEYLTDLLPPSLMFIDHYNPENKVLGITCLDHIVSNVPPSLLKLHGEADVIYDALHPLIYSREIHIITMLYPCLLKLISSEKKGIGSTLPKMWDHYDDVYHQLLLNVEMEGSLEHIKLYLCHITLFMKEVSVIKHLKHTMQVVRKCLAIFDGKEEHYRVESLRILLILIRKCWPRMEAHCEEILTMIMLLLYDIQANRDTLCDRAQDIVIVEACKDCLITLRRTCPVKFQAVVEDVIKDCSEFPGVDILQRLNDVDER